MRWTTITIISFLLVSIACAKEPAKKITNPRPDLTKIVTINLEEVAVRAVVQYYGAAIYRAPTQALYFDEATLRAVIETEKLIFGDDKFQKHFDEVQVYAESCLPAASILHAQVHVDLAKNMQKLINVNSWNRKTFCTYFGKFYHAGGPAKTSYGRKKNNKNYGILFNKIWKAELRKWNRGYWDDPTSLSWDDQMAVYHSLLYCFDLRAVKTLRRVEGGRHGKEMGHESPNNREVYGNPCVPAEARQYAKGTRSMFIALQNFILKDAWWRKTFFKYYADQRKMSKKQKDKYVKVVLRLRREQLELLKARVRLGGYNPVLFEGRVRSFLE